MPLVKRAYLERLKMGKIVKFCSSCDEGFAEKFGFCPNCGATLEAFEMNPMAASAGEKAAATPPAPAFIEPVAAKPELVAETVEGVAEIEEPIVEEPTIEEPVIKPGKSKAVAAAAPVFFQTQPMYADARPASLEDEHNAYASHGDYYITVIEEKNVGQRNGLLLGTLGLMIFAVFMGLVINIFSKDLDVGAISDDIFLASLIDEVPIDDQSPEIKKDKEDDGGGGGGGDDDPNPPSKGERPPMRTDPEFTPSATSDRLTNPTIPIQQAIKGPVNERIKIDGRYGTFNGGDIPSNGPGSGGGIGTSRGGGVGGGLGGGYGPGSGGGMGGGNNGGLGGGGGEGDGPPPKRVGVTQALDIISKPRPSYTDAARQNNVQGTVILRVTFLASGQIGGISAVKGLPNGLTEQAIAAARRISFSPKKIDGVGQSVTRQIEYTFSIY